MRSITQKDNQRLRKMSSQHLKVTYKNDLIGTLSYDDGIYTFEYSENFEALKIQPLPGIIPPKSSSATLWSYFRTRIPSTNTHVYRKLIDEYSLSEVDQQDVMVLLATVGSKVATDPFVVTYFE